MRMFRNIMIAALLVFSAGAAPSQAQAQYYGEKPELAYNAGYGYGYGYAPPPVYYAPPRPVYVPPPVFFAPPRYIPPPVYYAPRPYYGRPHWGPGRGHGRRW